MDVSVMTASEGEECLGAMNAALGAMERIQTRVEQIEKRLDALEDDGLVVCGRASDCGVTDCYHSNPHESDDECSDMDCFQITEGPAPICIPTKAPKP